VSVAALAGLFAVSCTTADQPQAVDSDTIPNGSPATGPAGTGPGDTGPDGTGTGPDEPPITAPDPVEPIAWGVCDNEDDLAPELDCATLTVPLDHDDPDGDTIDLALVRLAAVETRDGAVLFNPGGPGGSGVDIFSAVAVFMQGEMQLEAFDLIGFDPRGVDRSAGIRCLTDEELDATVFRDDIDDEVAEVEFVEACRARYGDTLRHFSTENTARDMDLIRGGLGDDTISYFGISYGTYLGAIYATLFPDRVEAFLLDSAFEPTDDTVEEQYLTQLVGFEDAFDAWATDCQGDPDCPLRVEDVGATWDSLRVELEQDPVPAADGRLANRSVLETATVAAMYDPLSWPILSLGIAETLEGDPTGLFQLADAYVGRRPDGSFATITQSNTVISCASGFTSEVPDDPEAFVDVLKTAAPRFARDVTVDSFGDDCTDLVPPVEMIEISYDGDGVFMVIGGVNDPATPMRWAEEMTEALGPTAALVTWAGEGHGQLLLSRCLKDQASRLLRTGELPAEGTVCEPDPEVGRPTWWNSIPVPDGVGEPLPAGTLASIGVPPSLAFGEARASTLEPEQILDAYEAALVEMGFQLLARTEDVPGVVSSTFFAPGNEILSILVVGDEALDDPEFSGVGRLLADGEVLVALLHIPF
jgi:pimeloyl-ACP methyl ester carboxylesterase